MTPTIADAIKRLCQIHHPNDGIKIEGNNLQDISCLTLSPESEPKFTWEDVLSKEIELNQEYTANQFQRDRMYPDLGEQLDLLFHDMTAGKGTKAGEWYKAIAKVKDDNPKPE